ncbi:MAG TPA: hypothetical protein VGI79_00875 [Caulobacteraceae bacterium]|jgi:hypothetical protein
MTLAQARQYLGALMASLTPGAVFLFLQLHVSGYTYNDDGSRNLGHLAKGTWLGLMLTVASSLVVLAAFVGAAFELVARMTAEARQPAPIDREQANG